MQALEKFSVIITFAVLSPCGSVAWAADSFVAKAKLTSFNVVPSIFATAEGELTITFMKPTTTGATIAQALPRRNPWGSGIRRPGNDLTSLRNIRLYFGQRFANGLPILTLCDDQFHSEFPEGGVPPCNLEIDEGSGGFELNDIQFQNAQLKAGGGGGIADNSCRQLTDDGDGFNLIRNLIKRGLIYVVVGSAFKASPDPDPACPGGIIYTPPAPDLTNPDGTERDLTTQFRDLFLIVDGELRGTLRLVK